MSSFLIKGAHYRAYAAASLANAEAAADKTTHDVHLAIARHFYRLAETEIDRVEGAQRPPLGGALRALRTVRCGGHPWKEPEVEEQLERLGFEEIETFAPGSLATMVVGRKPV